MKYFLLILMLICTPAIASPTNADTIVANQYMDALENTQSNYHSNNKRYQQVHARMGARKLVYKMDEYKGECGTGYIITVEKEIDAQLYRMQRHTGCETDRTIHTSWKKVN